MRAASERPPSTTRIPSTSTRFITILPETALLTRLRADALRRGRLRRAIIMRAMKHTAFSFGALVLACSVAALVAQQQAAEAPAPDRRASTRPAVAGLHGLVTTGHPI